MKNFKISAISFSGLLALLAVFLIYGQGDEERENQLTVFAASSFAWVLHENETLIEDGTGLDIIIVEAASSTLARQIAQGAPADVFITADAVWLDYLAEGGHYEAEPVEIARNRLVLVLTKNPCSLRFRTRPNAPVYIQACPIKDRLATGDPEFVPLGKYANESIKYYSWNLELTPAPDARAALALVRAEAVAGGILYRTDALAAFGQWQIYEIPEDSHTPIVYWAVAVKQTNSGKTKKFLDFLKSEDFKTILQSKGFEVN